jgi:tRNA(Ile)-lysidine synthase
MPSPSPPSKPDDLLVMVRKTLATHRMIVPGDRVLVGVSGGPDSMTLLTLLDRLADELKFRIGVAHLDHCLRGAASRKDADAVRRAARMLGHPLHMNRARVIKVKRKLGLSLEEAARRVRYAFFKKVMADAGYSKLALGHHADDNAEQMLMALLRGAGPRGLSGIAPVRERKIIRPLISARRMQIEVFSRKEGLPFVTDASNDDMRFMRNRMRHHLLPLLAAEYNPRIAQQLNRLADVCRAEDAWMDDMANVHYAQSLIKCEREAVALSVAALVQAPAALARRLIRKAIYDLAGTLRKITFSHVQSVLDLIDNNRGEKVSHLPSGIRVRRVGDQLLFSIHAGPSRRPGSREDGRKVPNPVTITAPFPDTIEIHAMGIGLRFFQCHPAQLSCWKHVSKSQAHFDLARLSLPLEVRPTIPGDRFVPMGAGGAQKLKKFFIDHHIPRHVRNQTTVLSDAERIIWVMGHRMSDAVKVTAQTTRVLGVEYFLLDT